MATNTKNFNFKKPDESDFYSIQDQNGNWDLADEELQKLNEPAFEDYTTGTSVPPAATALEALKSKIKLPVWMSNVVAFCKGCCTLAMIVNNCVSSDADKPLAAAQGKALQDQLTKLYSDLTPSFYPIPKPASINGLDNITIWEVRAFKSGKIVCLTINIDGVLSANTDWKILFTLPNEYRPSEGPVILNYITQHGKAMVIDINTGGDVRIVCPSGEGILKGDWACRQCITYVTEA